MEHVELSVDLIGGAIAALAVVVYIIRMEGKVNLITEILNRIEGDAHRRLDIIERRLHHEIPSNTNRFGPR